MVLLLASPAFAGPLSGHYVSESSSNELAQIHDRAVHEGLASMSWFLRPLARAPLRRTVTSCTELDLQLDDDGLRVTCPGSGPVWVARPLVSRAYRADDGAEVTVVARERVDGITVRFERAEGCLQTSYTRTEQGLLVSRELTSRYLADPVRWDVRYLRAR